MIVRLATERDTDAIVAMARTNMQTRPTLTFNEARCRATVASYLAHAAPTIYVAESRGEVVGMLVCDFYEYRAADGLFAVQEVLFVCPNKRGTRAAAMLMRQLLEWADTIGAREIVGGNDNEYHSEQTARFLSRFGFKQVGYAMRREV